MKKATTILLVLSFLAIGSLALAQEQNNVSDDSRDVTAEELGIQEPNILPDSPFYFVKEWTRNIQSFLTFNSLKKIELQNKIAGEKLLEAKKLAEKTKRPEIIKKALENYQKALDRVKNRAEKIKEETANSTTTQKFLEKFEAQRELHQRILRKLETKVPEQVLEKVKETRQKHLEKFEEVIEKIQEKINAKPEACTMEYAPVCGKDNKTYSNKCVAKVAGAEIDYAGECGKQETACQIDTDCACGRNKENQECAIGNEKYIDSNVEAQCPDFCSGFGGNLETRCLENECQQVPR